MVAMAPDMVKIGVPGAMQTLPVVLSASFLYSRPAHQGGAFIFWKWVRDMVI
jgi:hypothetical protein